MSPPVAIGEVLAGKYRVERVLGSGGMGVVVAATHLRLEQLVAIKLLLDSALESEEIVARFAREARAASRIQSEHVARVIDVGELASGAPYMVMEYLEGSDLSQLLETEGPLPVARAVDYVLEACEALAEAHAVGIVHRDLKPSNLFLANRADGSAIVKVLDFGISKAATEAGMSVARLTGTAVIMGSPLYMSPEQLRSSRDVDARTDVWSLGIILYELIGGVTPYPGESVTETIANIMTEEAPPLATLCRDLPPKLQGVIDRCLQKKRDERYASIVELAEDLASFGSPAARVSAEIVRRVLRAPPTVRGPAVSPPAISVAKGPAPTLRESREPVCVSAETATQLSMTPLGGGERTPPLPPAQSTGFLPVFAVIAAGVLGVAVFAATRGTRAEVTLQAAPGSVPVSGDPASSPAVPPALPAIASALPVASVPGPSPAESDPVKPPGSGSQGAPPRLPGKAPLQPPRGTGGGPAVTIVPAPPPTVVAPLLPPTAVSPLDKLNNVQ